MYISKNYLIWERYEWKIYCLSEIRSFFRITLYIYQDWNKLQQATYVQVSDMYIWRWWRCLFNLCQYLSCWPWCFISPIQSSILLWLWCQRRGILHFSNWWVDKWQYWSFFKMIYNQVEVKHWNTNVCEH